MKMSWTDWPNFAYTHKLCLINWPVGAVPPGQTDEKYDIKKKSNGVSQQCLKNSNAKRREDPESDDALCIRIVSWDAEDLELDPEDDDYGSIPLVSDSEGYSVFSVNNCKLYQQAKKTGDFDVSKKKRRTLKDKLSPTLYKSRKFLPKNVNFIDLDAPDPVPEASTHTKRPHTNDNDEERIPQKRTRSDNDVPGPSKPKNPRTEVAGPRNGRAHQIKWWMAYQYWKDCEHAAKDTSVQEAFLGLLQQLTGKGFPKPHCVTAANHWHALPENWALAEEEVTKHMELSTSRKQCAGIHTETVSKLFNALPPEVQEEWKGMSKEQHDLAIAEWTCKTESPPAEAPTAQQSYIEVTVPFMQKILDLISTLTGMKSTFMFSGPEPANGGPLNIISVKMNFGASKQEYHQKLIIPVFSRFLKKCYTIEDCRARVHPDATPSLASLMDEHANYMSLISLRDLSELFSKPSPPPTMPSENSTGFTMKA
ncbi:hypothetical protein DXG01_015866 [Tephrocybe rancida]|nr:hypothetical protein DXG01_015866 [Tephrocybe rancida]